MFPFQSKQVANVFDRANLASGQSELQQVLISKTNKGIDPTMKNYLIVDKKRKEISADLKEQN